MKILKVDQLLEAKGYPGLSKNFRKQGSYGVTAIKNSNEIEFSGSTVGEIYTNIIDWLYKNGYQFDGLTHSPKVRKLFTSKDIESESSYGFNDFYEFADDKYLMLRKINTGQIMSNIKLMFNNFDVNDVKFIGFNESEESPSEESEISVVDKIKIFVKNPFRQSICILGESGAGKSTTILNILKESGHKVQFIIPSISTTGLLSQFSPSKNYIPSRLGKFLIQASEDSKNFYTVVFDECHKSNIIEMINDELLQAISTKRNNGRRFLPLDDTIEYLSEYLEEDEVGNLLVPDNFGFIFISSKPKVIANNEDFFNRVEFAELLRGRDIIENEDGSVTSNIKSISDLLSLVNLTDRSRFKSLRFED